MKKGIYVYCFIEGIVSGNVALAGIEEDNGIYFITKNGITAAISNTRLKVYEPNKLNMLTHERVIRFLMRSFNLIPCSFGSVFQSKTDLKNYMGKSGSCIKTNLARLKGKEERILRIFWKKAAFSAEIETPDIIALKHNLNGSYRARASLGILELGQLVEEKVDTKRQYYIEEIYLPLARAAEEAKLLEVIVPRMVFNAAFLIGKENAQELDKMAVEILEEYQDRLDISYTGPWPPYNFITLDIDGYSRY